ncbi:MBL fold metallo-hydrolase [Isoptericola variabilis]|uniref:Zn-dependent hydrolase of the beta-lactamase fold-like protein n=1 Tax=Isoptericola variabilis (strain 225) TaxID=743718 RepID=F6FUZ0_ISOV2|nr:MBL fold metallo-hydrolase [Isoptericola variabilis]AEG44330.1 Zn-dependent hydrolase of the beta-lactamase fold-like protein [Isoptericola variabilis 225]TWH31082.1 L-ascorbate metabolism protein UlaG (beta-lactamase superfamily) [Isoptericola variabilis J7]
MRLTSYGHSCVRLDGGATRVVVDPGTYADAAGALEGATAVLVTHEHPDHVDTGALVPALHADPALEVWGTHGAVALLTGAGAPERVHAVAPGETLQLADARVTVGGGLHAVIHPRLERIENRTYLVELDGAVVHHPGDSFDLPPGSVDVLLVPVAAPWLKLAEAVDHTLAASARLVVPVHDAPLSEVGHGLVAKFLDTARLGGEHEYRRLRAGESLDV